MNTRRRQLRRKTGRSSRGRAWAGAIYRKLHAIENQMNRFQQSMFVPVKPADVADVTEDTPTLDSARAEILQKLPGGLAIQATKPGQVFQQLFTATLDPDEERGFARFLSMFHSEVTQGFTAIEHIRHFTWRQARKHVDLYLEGRDPTTFTFSRTVPPHPLPDADTIKFFVYSPSRSAVPVTLKKDPQAGDTWRVTFCSL